MEINRSKDKVYILPPGACDLAMGACVGANDAIDHQRKRSIYSSVPWREIMGEHAWGSLFRQRHGACARRSRNMAA